MNGKNSLLTIEIRLSMLSEKSIKLSIMTRFIKIYMYICIYYLRCLNYKLKWGGGGG